MILLDICSGISTVNSSGTIITTPGYSVENYPHNLDCEIGVRFKEGKSIVITFIGEFGIEHHGTCIYDYIEIFDDPSYDAPAIDKICGLSNPGIKEINGYFARIKFHSDSHVNNKGFSLQLTEKDPQNGKISF